MDSRIPLAVARKTTNTGITRIAPKRSALETVETRPRRSCTQMTTRRTRLRRAKMIPMPRIHSFVVPIQPCGGGTPPSVWGEASSRCAARAASAPRTARFTSCCRGNPSARLRRPWRRRAFPSPRRATCRRRATRACPRPSWAERPHGSSGSSSRPRPPPWPASECRGQPTTQKSGRSIRTTQERRRRNRIPAWPFAPPFSKNSRTPVKPDVIAVAIVVRKRPRLVKRDSLGVLVVQPLQNSSQIVEEEILAPDAPAVHGERDRSVVVHPEVTAVDREVLPLKVHPALPRVSELLLLRGFDREVLRNADQDLAVGQELAARAAQSEHVLQQGHFDVRLELPDARVVADLDDVVVGMRLLVDGADPKEVPEIP